MFLLVVGHLNPGYGQYGILQLGARKEKSGEWGSQRRAISRGVGIPASPNNLLQR